MFGKILNTLIVAALLSGAGFVYAPYKSVADLSQALENENVAAVDAAVDFDAVKKSLNNDFAKELGINTGPDEKSLGATIAATLVGSFLGQIVSPETMVTVFKDKSRRDRIGLSTQAGEILSRSAWQGTDKFVVFNGDGEPTMLFKRDGFMAWHLTGLRVN
ncbi:MAG: DUF2939 domain-containing protein [Proteobacteria bacterium]|nr:DUF2939 domain-containing protein [Pseudomonadota bacterium]